MFGNRWKSWMESHLPRVRQGPPNPRKRHEAAPDLRPFPSSASTDTSILLGPSSSGSFSQNLSSPDTGYSTDGCSPQTAYPHLSFQNQKSALLSKTSLLCGNGRLREDSPRRAKGRPRPLPPSPPLIKVPQPGEERRRSNGSAWSDSGQGSMSLTPRNSADSSGHRLSGLQSTISEEPDLKETDILSDWAPTDEDVDENELTPTPSSPNMNLPTVLLPPPAPLPRAYETLQLLNQCNHVFPLPTCTGPRCLGAQLGGPLNSSKGRRGRRGPIRFLLRLFRRNRGGDRDPGGGLPEISRGSGKPIRGTLGGGHWLTPTPNSFRKRTEVSTIPRGLKSDIIRLPGSSPAPYIAPSPLPRESWTPTASHQSPFLRGRTPVGASPASLRFQPIVTPVLARFLPASGGPSPKHPPPPCPLEPGPRHPPAPSFNNYSPIHRLVVTGIHRHAPESPLVRTTLTPTFRVPAPRVPLRQSPLPAVRNPRYTYIPSSNQNSPLLNHPKRMGEVKGHYYASPLVQNNPRAPPPAPAVDRIYERVEGTEGSDEGDGEGGDYEWDLSFGDSEQSSESWRPQAPVPPVPRDSFPMQWGTRLSETETRLLEREADLKYKRLLWEAEALLRELSEGPARPLREEFAGRAAARPRHLLDETPQSDPLRRKTYDCWALRRLQQEMAGSCASPPVLHRSRQNLINFNAAGPGRLPGNKPATSRTLHLHPHHSHHHRV